MSSNINNNDNIINSYINSFLKQYDENFAVKLGKIDNKSLVMYIVIIIIALFLAKMLEISLSIIFFLLLALLICYIIYSKKKISEVELSEENKIKNDLINPKPKKFVKYPDIVDFFYSIREFYNINPSAFFGMVNDTDNFLSLYESIMKNKMIYCKQNIEVAVDFIRSAQNHFHSMIYNLATDKILTEKFHQAMKEYHKLMYQYINRIIDQCNNQFNRNQINNSSGFYDQYGPKPFNYFAHDEANSRFEFY
jgi:hypothetical protein